MLELYGRVATCEDDDVSLVTLSASYGAGGSQVGPALAERLGVLFLDRVIPTEVASRLAVPLAAALAREEPVSGLLDRLFMSLTRLAPIGQGYGAGGPAPEPLGGQSFREMTEEVIFEWADRGQGVILGRAGAVVLRDYPQALHVRLDGPREARLQQAMRLQGIERATAERRMEETDRARYAYVRQFYHADARDPSLYHLLVNSTLIDLNLCVDVIALAVEGRGVGIERRGPRNGLCAVCRGGGRIGPRRQRRRRRAHASGRRRGRPVAGSLHPARTSRRGRIADPRLCFPAARPDRRPAYRRPNDRVLAWAEQSDGRLTPYCRLDPAEDPVGEAERCLSLGARGIKLHPRAQAFGFGDAAAEGSSPSPGMPRFPILIHAGRGMPPMDPLAELALRFPT